MEKGNQHIRQVPWISRAEWDFVKNCLFAVDNDSNRESHTEALGRLSAWKSRLGNKFPLALECTSGLISASLADTTEANKENISQLYGIALLRCISLLTDSFQEGYRAIPMHTLAQKMAIPSWIVGLRHDATHSCQLPSLSVLRVGVSKLLDWLKREFWDAYNPCSKKQFTPETEYISDFKAEGELSSLLVEYQQIQFKHLPHSSPGASPKFHTKRIVTRIKARLKNADAKSTFVWLLTQDGYLVPTEDQVQAMGINLNALNDDKLHLDQKLILFWRPILTLVHEKSMTIILLQEMVKVLSRIPGTEESRAILSCLVGWATTIIAAATGTQGESLESVNLLKGSFLNPKLQEHQWHSLLLTCLMNINQNTAIIFKLLMDDVLLNLDQPTRNKLNTLAQISALNITDVSNDLRVTYDLNHFYEEVGKKLEERNNSEMKQQMVKEKDAERLREDAGCDVPWMLSSDAVRWHDYPLGVIPGQSDDPQCFTLQLGNEQKSLDSFIWPTNHQRCDLEYERPQEEKQAELLSGEFKSLTTDLDEFSKEEVKALKQSISLL